LEIDNGLSFNKLLLAAKTRMSIIYKENNPVKHFFKKVDFLFPSLAASYESRCFLKRKWRGFSLRTQTKKPSVLKEGEWIGF
jgi:hypothetical protein